MADEVGVLRCSDGEAAARGSDATGGRVSCSWGSSGSVDASSVEHAVFVIDSVAEAREADGKSCGEGWGRWTWGDDEAGAL